MWQFGVPNAPCGVERLLNNPPKGYRGMFLMHRVELKEAFINSTATFCALVPNAPCGVERSERTTTLSFSLSVPNAPCGVERGLHL